VRFFVKIAEPNMWVEQAVVVWWNHHGPVPLGMLLHHKDGNSLNDAICNLRLVSRAEHLALHRPAFENKRSRLATAARWGHE
jgi:hypothetical protein